MNDQLTITNLRCLALDTIDKANSGHPGMALGSAAILHTIYSRHMIANPSDPNWFKRDRFILSSGHVSSLLYSLLHIAGYNISIDDLKEFRQLNSITPGHPERGVTDGVDLSTGPLGQGIASAVGMAISEKHLVALHPEFKHLLEHYTYVLCGDGDLQEGVALEALSLASLYKLNKLIICYDNNDVTLDGPLSQSSKEDLVKKFEGMGLNVLTVEDGNNDVDAIDKAIIKAKEQQEKPTIIIIKTTIGYGSALAGNHKVHGAPLKEEGSQKVKDFLGWIYPKFYVHEESIKTYEETFKARSNKAYEEYRNAINKLNPHDKALYARILKNEDEVIDIKNYPVGYSNATRNVSGEVLNLYSSNMDSLFGGSADVEGSVKTGIKNKVNFTSDTPEGQNICFGIREHAMASICNGIAAHGGLKPYCGCFLVFSDYARGALRCSALMGLPVTYLFSHDSIAVGEDGPTHQPIEQIASLRMIPNFNVIRPADANETVGAYKVAMKNNSFPTAIILTRQNVPTYAGYSASKVKLGGYVVSYEKKNLQAIIVATGSEVALAIEAQKELAKKHIDVRVVSMPSTFLFEQRSNKYKNGVLPNKDITIAVELGNGDAWYKYAKYVMSNDEFGKSCKYEDLIKEREFTVETLVKKVSKIAKKN